MQHELSAGRCIATLWLSLVACPSEAAYATACYALLVLKRNPGPKDEPMVTGQDGVMVEQTLVGMGDRLASVQQHGLNGRHG